MKKIANKVLYFEKCSGARIARTNGAGARAYDEGISSMSAMCSTKFFEFGYDDYEKYVKEQEEKNEGARTARPYDASGNARPHEETHQHDVDLQSVVPSNNILSTNNITTMDDLSNKDNYQLSKQKNKDKKRAKKLENEIARIEDDISKLHDSLMDEKNQTNFEELTKINNEIEELNTLLENKYAEWDELSQ